MRRRRAATGVALTVLALLAFGCTDGADDGAGSGGSTTASTAAPMSTTTTPPPADHSDAAPVGEAATGEPVPSPGCSSGSARSDVVTAFHHDLRVGGTDRWYLLTTPPATGDHRPTPLVVDLHGLMEGADVHALMTRSGEAGQREGFAVAFPQGSGQPVRWDTTSGDANPDLRMLDAMIEQIGAERCIDQSRVYAEGLSYGAIMTSQLACERAGRFAAVATVDGISVPDGCAPSRPVPVIAFHGTADPILGFNGQGGDLGRLTGGSTSTPSSTVAADLDGPGYPANAAAWAARNGCATGPTDTEVGREVVHRVFDCPDGADVEFYIVLGGGHSWPGSEFSRSIGAVVGHTTFDVDASGEIWQFFRRFRLPDGPPA